MRRTSLRDKTLTTKKDAVEEARLRLQAQEATDSGSTAATAAADLPNGYAYHTTNNNNNNNNNINSSEKRPSTASLSHSKSADAVDNITLTTTHSYLPRRPPDGRENDEQLLKAGDPGAGGGELQRATSAAAVILTDQGTAASAEALQIQSSKAANNGKINVQVTVLVGE